MPAQGLWPHALPGGSCPLPWLPPRPLSLAGGQDCPLPSPGEGGSTTGGVAGGTAGVVGVSVGVGAGVGSGTGAGMGVGVGVGVGEGAGRGSSGGLRRGGAGGGADSGVAGVDRGTGTNGCTIGAGRLRGCARATTTAGGSGLGTRRSSGTLAGGSAAITTDDDEAERGRLSGLPATVAGPRSFDGVASRPAAAVSDSATTAPCAQESLM